MGNRLSKIYTRTGDDGSTGLGDGQRVGKDSLRVQAYGNADELNSHIGHLLALGAPQSVSAVLACVQHHLFDIGSELCVPEMVSIEQALVDWLEGRLDEINAELPYLKEFILPGGNQAAAVCHVARTVCRRTERDVIALSRVESVNPVSIKYLNRLSDYLFVAAREILRSAGAAEVCWQPHQALPGGAR